MALAGSRRGDGGAVVQNLGNEMVKMNKKTMAGQADAGSEIDMDGMELDNDCLVQVGSAGAGGAAVDEPTPAENQKCEPRRRCEVRLASYVRAYDY